MKQLTLLLLCLFFLIHASFGQKKMPKQKEIFIEKITSTLNPLNGKDDTLSLSYSGEVWKKYQFDGFQFYKINVLDGSDCNFNYFNGEDYQGASLNEGDYFPYEVTNKDKTIRFKIKYVKYIYNKAKPLTSQTVVEFYVYKTTKKK